MHAAHRLARQADGRQPDPTDGFAGGPHMAVAAAFGICDPAPMILPLLLGASLAWQVENSGSQSSEAPAGYRVFAFRYERRCGYAVTDIIGITGTQLERTLSADGYDPASGLQIVTTPATPQRCVTAVRRIATKLKFRTITVRSAVAGEAPAPPN